MRPRLLPLAAVLCLAPAPLLCAQEAGKETDPWDWALRVFRRRHASRDPYERAEAAKALGAALGPGRHDEAARLLYRLLRDEVHRGRYRERMLRIEVVEAAVASLRRIGESSALAFLEERIFTAHLPWRLRFHLLEGAGNPHRRPTRRLLVRALRHEDPRLRIAAAERLGDTHHAEALEPLLDALADPYWQVRAAAVQSLRRLHPADPTLRPRILDGLVRLLGAEEAEQGRMAFEAVTALRDLAGCDRGWHAADWRAWLDARRRGEPPPDEPLTRPVIPAYHGLPIHANRVVFVVDVTGSMRDPASHTGRLRDVPPRLPPHALACARGQEALADRLDALHRENRARKVSTKLDAEKKELIHALLHLPGRVRFALLFYASDTRAWRPGLAPATAENKIDAAEAVADLVPSGGTDLFGALDELFRLRSERAPSGSGRKEDFQRTRTALDDLDAGVEEAFLLTDGRPTQGAFTDPVRIRREFRKRNRLRSIRLHAIAVGRRGQGMSPVDTAFLRLLAFENGGSFVHVR